MLCVQTEMFDSDIDIIRKENKVTFDRIENVRKGLFKRHNELAKMYTQLHEECRQMRWEISNLRKEMHGEKVDDTQKILMFA